MERDQIADDCNFPAVNFNSHAHVERDAKTAMTIRMIFNFNSHAHVERDEWTVITCFGLRISTHTLTWSVTNAMQRHTALTTISTHTLTWSVTLSTFGR